ncbi:MAG TPA: heat-inducible transcriptional repressor HrcA [Geobacteraceae bacterium]|nr:heat-inducible transcriptional repressor HrcA [Geobacteraceae bacterium]
MDNLSERSKHILEAIIEEYIRTAEPVGSRAISRRHGLTLSPATIRNVMADLEDLDFLASPHTSAGRIPTDKAFRFYVDSLLTVGTIDREQEELIQRQYRLYGKDVGEIFKETSRILSSLSHYMGIVVTPRFTTTMFRHIEFIKLGGRRILAILVSKSGIVQNKIIEADEDLSSEDMVRMSNYLNNLLKGLSIAELRSRILREMQDEKVRYDEMLAKALKLSEQTLDENGTEVFIEGRVNILEQPEFADVGKMREVFRAFEEKGQLISLLDRCMESEGVHIFIGAENYMHHLESMSVITAPYMSGKETVGVLGVIGPTRMGYDRVIPIVDYTAKVLSKLLDVE